MKSRVRVTAVTALVMMMAAGLVAHAGPSGGSHGGGGGGGGGGGHAAGGFSGGGAKAGGSNAGGAWHGAGSLQGGGWRGGAWHGGYGWRGGYYGCCGWGWGLGFYLPLLPWYYETYWWRGMPYYYADGSYYLWNGDIGEYESVEPPSTLSPEPPPGVSVNPAVSTELFAYPKGDQSEAQQKQDKEECRRWAISQSGFDPAAPPAAQESGDPRQAYLRAQAACLEARNYSVR